MNFELIKTSVEYILKGTILHKDGTPNKGCQVILYDVNRDTVINRATTDRFGNYKFVYAIADLPPSQYIMKFRGTGEKEALKPLGVWEPFEIIDLNLNNSDLKIFSTNGQLFKFKDSVYDPTSTTLVAQVSNVTNLAYNWQLDGNYLNIYTSGITLNAEDVFLDKDIHTYSCTVSGLRNDNSVYGPETASVSLVKISNGSIGPGVVFRGKYDGTKTYYRTDVRADVVLSGSNYYLCKTTTPSPAGAWAGVGTYWESFSNQFSSVATDILLAQDATITRTLVMGTEDGSTYGAIRSVLANSLTNGNGFFISETEDGSGNFRVGKSTVISGLSSGISWDGNIIKIKATNMEITDDGGLWANSGGFGGTVASPKLTLTSVGLQAGETLIHGDPTWKSQTISGALDNSDIPGDYNITTSGYITASGIVLPYTGVNAEYLDTPVITVDSADLGKVFVFETKIATSGGIAGDIHKVKVESILNSNIMQTNWFDKGNGTTTPIIVNFYPQTSGNLKFKLTYNTVYAGTQELPEI